MLDLETVLYVILLLVSIPLSVVSLIMAANKRFSKGITAWIVTLSVVNIFISLLVWAAVLLVGGMIALAFM